MSVVARARKGIAHWVSTFGPGLITGAADDDPSGISTYAIAGATAGYSMLWIALLTTPMMAVIQGMCARIGMVSGEGLAAVIRRSFPRWVGLAILAIVLIANTLNIGADLGGMSAAAVLLVPSPPVLWTVVFGLALIALQVYSSHQIFVRVVKWLTISLFAYVVTAFVVQPDWLTVLRHTVVPEIRLNRDWLATLTAVLGTTITPYLFFWQASLEVEEERSQGQTTIASRRGASADEIAAMHEDVNTGMIFSNVVAFFIILTTAATLAAHGVTKIQSAADAANALRPLAGNFAYVLFTAGMVGTGLLAIPALSGSSAFVVAEMLRVREGFDKKPRQAPQFYAVIIGSLLVGVAMNLLHVNAIQALFWSAVINGIAAVPLIAVIIALANRKKLMGRWLPSRLANAWAFLTLGVMAFAAVAMFVF